MYLTEVIIFCMFFSDFKYKFIIIYSKKSTLSSALSKKSQLNDGIIYSKLKMRNLL